MKMITTLPIPIFDYGMTDSNYGLTVYEKGANT